MLYASCRRKRRMHVHDSIMGVTDSGADIAQWTDGDPLHIYNGMPSSVVPITGGWVKSRLSNPSGNCVELAELADGNGVALRNSRHPGGPALIYTRAEIEAFVKGAAAGDFDGFLP